MFACRAFRPATRFSRHVRRYATESSSGGSSTNALLYGGLGLGALGGGYYIYSRNQGGALAPAGQGKAQGQEQASSDVNKIFQGGDQGFITLPLDKIEDINHNTKRFRFTFEDSEAVSGLPVASALVTKFKGENDEKPTIKPYTPVTDENQKGYLDFIIKKYPNGPMSEHIHSLKTGDTLDIKGPIPKYPWAANKHPEIACIAGGTGITPMWQLINAIFKNPEDKTKVTLIFGNVTEEDILLRKDLEGIENKYPDRFRAFYVLDNPPENWQQGKGFITKDLLKETIPGPDQENIKVFICGPPGLCKAISGEKKSPAEQGELTGFLKELGYKDDQVYKF